MKIEVCKEWDVKCRHLSFCVFVFILPFYMVHGLIEYDEGSGYMLNRERSMCSGAFSNQIKSSFPR